jgi:RNA polymerase sigma-70 factor (ECF subfamily)
VREADIKDVAQELFVAVYHRLGEYDASRPSKPWLFSFSLRFAANYRRLSRTRGHVSDDVLYAHALPANDHEARDLVLRALAELDFERRVVIVMHDLEGFAAPDIASQLGVLLNTVYSRLRLARADFRNAVERLQTERGAHD